MRAKQFNLLQYGILQNVFDQRDQINFAIHLFIKQEDHRGANRYPAVTAMLLKRFGIFNVFKYEAG